jgi:hypothetical protein
MLGIAETVFAVRFPSSSACLLFEQLMALFMAGTLYGEPLVRSRERRIQGRFSNLQPGQIRRNCKSSTKVTTKLRGFFKFSAG